MAKVEVRIAVAIGSEGNWGASGWGNFIQNADDAMNVALECLGEYEVDARYWITLELEVPEIVAPIEIGADQVVVEVAQRDRAAA